MYILCLMNKLDLGDILPYIPGGISNLLPVHTNLRSFGGMVTSCVGKRSNPMDPSVFLVGGFGFELCMLTVMMYLPVRVLLCFLFVS